MKIIPGQGATAFGEVHQPTWVSSEDFLLAQKNFQNTTRNGGHQI